MKKFFSLFFMTLGVVFFILILIGGYLFVFDPFELRSMFSAVSQETMEYEGTGSDKEASGEESRFSAPQRAMLEAYGIDPERVSVSFTAEQEACFESKLGASRVAEITAGGVPTPAELYVAKECW